MEAETKIGHININNMGLEVEMEQEVKINTKYVPSTLPPNTNRIYNVLVVDVNKKYPKETLENYLCMALVKAIKK